MEKRISYFEWQNALSVAKIIDPMVRAKKQALEQYDKLVDQHNKLLAKVEEKSAELVALEKEIDAINATLPPFRCFILPGGCRAAALCHVCRTVCRRAERRILALCEEGAEVDANVIAYVNRLSDYLFTLARKLNVDENHPEIIWQRKK